LFSQLHFGVLVLLFVYVGCGKQDLPFETDGERAYEIVTFLADSIGPRVPGSAEDVITRDYIADEMEKIGLEVERQFVPSVWAAGSYVRYEREFRVESENIIGILPGATDRVILLSGHFDSSGRSVPGANDNASSIGVLLETARVIADTEWNATIIFAAFCAEERGLLGSQYYVENTDLSNLVLAINMDPVGYGNLLVSPIPGDPPLSVQREFIRLARKHGIRKASIDPMQILVPRYLPLGFGADHMSFLDAGYPAFSINNTFKGWNYHTTHDRSEYIDPTILHSAVEMLIAFLLEYDDNKEAPVFESPVYIAQPIFGNIYVFVTELYLFALVIVSFVVFLYFGIAERHSIKNIQLIGFIIVFLKMVLLAIIQVMFIFLPVFAGMILERTLYPWMANPPLYMAMGIASGMVGLFFIVQLAKLMNLEPGVKQLKYWAILILLIYTIVAVSYLGFDVAYYFAAPLILFLLSLRISGTIWSLIIGGMGVFPLLGSVGPSQISMVITLLGISIPVFTLMVTVFILSLPFIFYFAGALQSEDIVGHQIRSSLSHTITPILAMLCVIGLYFWAYMMDVYDKQNPQLINQTAVFDLNADEGTLHLSSYDYIPVMQDKISGQFIEPDELIVRYPLEIDPGLTDLVIESKADGDLRSIYFEMSVPAYRDYIGIEISSAEPFNVVSSEFDERRQNRRTYSLNILSSEGTFRDTVIVELNAPLQVQYIIRTFDASEQPIFVPVTHPLAFRYDQYMRAVVEID